MLNKFNFCFNGIITSLGFFVIIYLYLTSRHCGLFILSAPQQRSFERQMFHGKNDSKSFGSGILIFIETKIYSKQISSRNYS